MNIELLLQGTTLVSDKYQKSSRSVSTRSYHPLGIQARNRVAKPCLQCDLELVIISRLQQLTNRDALIVEWNKVTRDILCPRWFWNEIVQ